MLSPRNWFILVTPSDSPRQSAEGLACSLAAAQLGDSLRSGRTQKSGYVQPRSFEGGPGVVIDCEQSVLFARNGVRVAFLSFEEVVVLKAYFFSAQFFRRRPGRRCRGRVDGLVLPLVVVINDDDGYKV